MYVITGYLVHQSTPKPYKARWCLHFTWWKIQS